MLTAEQLAEAAREHVDELCSRDLAATDWLSERGIDNDALYLLARAMLHAGVIDTSEKVSRADNVVAGFIAGWMVGWDTHVRLGAVAAEFTA